MDYRAKNTVLVVTASRTARLPFSQSDFTPQQFHP